ncbi:sigma-54-dependent Fis family transcriptional regulator [Nakamurella sp. PAMC28650]|uniref:sigma-54-dependent Fis family transcriptional regulator n=1 Tax=Nakamurella sp. PAMC28650 TaxID=2762325 RepID=UPI002102C2E6|nr:helix-turn-helix domain-containing protein [Nakamurella sp. PAMC28650]
MYQEQPHQQTPVLPGLRPEIALSWARSRDVGLVPEDALSHLRTGEFDAQSRLLSAASPVLDTLRSQLRGSAHSVLLADRECRVIHRWCDETRAEGTFDDLGVRPGATCREEVVGTNGLGTALELRRGVAINGSEHFADELKAFSCYGQPILHPLTNRVEGVLNFTSFGAGVNPLLAALVAHSVDHVQQRLLDGARASERLLFAAFQTMTAHRRHPVVALGDDVVLSNRAALDLLNPHDFALLRALVGPVGSESGFAADVPLQNGMRATVLAHAVSGSAGGFVFEITPAAEVVGGSADRGSLRDQRGPRLPILISGAPGTGRSRAATAAVQRHPVTVLEPGFAALDGEAAWAQRFVDAISSRAGTVVVEEIDLLSDRLIHLIISLAKKNFRSDLIVTCGPMDGLTGLAHTLASMCVRSVDLPALSRQAAVIGDLAARMLDEVSGGAPLRLTPSAIDALSTQAWIGNFHELRVVMTYVAARRSAGDVTAADLPASYRTAAPPSNLGGLDRVERDAIVAALAEHDGNKMRTAKALGVSRGTLYNRMRRLRITTSSRA